VRVLPVALGVLAVAAFAIEGLAYSTWAVERSPDCSGEPSLECATFVVIGPLFALAGALAVGVAVGFAVAFYFRGRARHAAITAVSALAVLAGVHLVLLL
jgi:hypothetical protein